MYFCAKICKNSIRVRVLNDRVYICNDQTDEDSLLSRILAVKTTTLKSIPKCTHGQCCDTYCKLLTNVLSDANNKDHWLRLLSFCWVVLAKPKRGGKTSLSSQILGRVKAFNENTFNLQLTPQKSFVTNKPNDEQLSRKVCEKLGEGNISAAAKLQPTPLLPQTMTH